MLIWKTEKSPQIASFQNYPNQPVQSVGGYPNPTSIYPNGQTQQPTNPNIISNQTQNLQKSNSDRYAALAELDTEIKQNQIQRKQIIKFNFQRLLWFLRIYWKICKKRKA